MKVIDRIVKFITENKLIFILFAVFVAFHLFFEKYITTLFVNTFFCYLKSSRIIDCITIVSLLLIIRYFKKSIKSNTYISTQIIVLSIGLLLTIGYYRFFSDIWTFTPMFLCKQIKYIDILLIFLIFNIVIRICVRKRYFQSSNGFLFGNPIKDTNNDLLNRSKIAETLVAQIKNTADPDGAFAIGICSEWGDGKTSFLYLIKSYFDKKDINRIIVDFNPWLNNDENAIITSFFDELSRNFNENKELSKDLIEYAEILNAISNNGTEKIINLFKAKHSNNLSLKFKSINEAIQKSGKQIVIFIDDLDRLYEKEILEVLRLIRNSASFANTVFVVAYDRNYLISALKKANEYRPNFYLEKIFQLEIMLPKFEKYIMADILKERLIPYIEEADKQKLKDIFNQNVNYGGFDYYLLTNFRDIYRFANSFIHSYKLLKGEIELLDLLNLELLRIRYLGVYSILSKNYMSFLEEQKIYANDRDSYLTIRKLKDKDDSKKVIEKTVLEEYLENNLAEAGIQKNQIPNVIKYVANIFPDRMYSIRKGTNSILSIANPIAIERYFHYNLLNSNLSEMTFTEFRAKTEDEFQLKIKKWAFSGFYKEIAVRLEHIEAFKNKEDYEKVINAIFFYASIPTSDGRCLGFDNDNLLSKLQYNSTKEFYNTEEDFKGFIIELFNKQNSPYLFVSAFIDNIFKEIAFEWKFILTKNDLIQQKLIYFKQYSESINQIDKYFFWLYHYCGYTEVDNGNGSRSAQEVSPSQAAKDIFIACAKRLSNNFLKSIITRRGLGEDRSKALFAIANVVRDVWDSWDNFETYLVELDENQVPTLKEFKDFFNKYKEVNYNRYIEYTFKDIDLSDALLFNA